MKKNSSGPEQLPRCLQNALKIIWNQVFLRYKYQKFCQGASPPEPPKPPPRPFLDPSYGPEMKVNTSRGIVTQAIF